uniref:Uncharacterized protein n=1 Tax=Hippocampus comes TaxID=109280 RepID=A0A3Q2YUD8_HIPCM
MRLALRSRAGVRLARCQRSQDKTGGGAAEEECRPSSSIIAAARALPLRDHQNPRRSQDPTESIQWPKSPPPCPRRLPTFRRTPGKAFASGPEEGWRQSRVESRSSLPGVHVDCSELSGTLEKKKC